MGSDSMTLTTTSTSLDDAHFRLLLNLCMVSDPWPLTEEEGISLKGLLNGESKKRGFESWIGAYHLSKGCPSELEQGQQTLRELLKVEIDYLEILADRLDHRALESREGGWSTHQVASNRATAGGIRGRISEIRNVLGKIREEEILRSGEGERSP